MVDDGLGHGRRPLATSRWLEALAAALAFLLFLAGFAQLALNQPGWSATAWAISSLAIAGLGSLLLLYPQAATRHVVGYIGVAAAYIAAASWLSP